MKLPPPSLARIRLTTVEPIRSWLTPAPGREDVQRDPRTLSFAFALLFGSGGVLVLFTLLLPHSADRDLPALVAVATAAMAVTAAMATIGRKCSMWVFRALPLLGGVLVSIVAFSGGANAISAYAMFYFWVILSAFYFFPGWWGLVNLGSVAVQYGLVASWSGTPNGELKWVMLIGTLGVTAVFLSVLQDYADRATREREKLLAQVEQLASTDPLTGLPNRRAWQRRLVEELRRAARQKKRLALVLVDIDGLKEINDRGGHEEGDRVLLRATTAWRGALRETDFIARLGGDEFGALLPDCPDGEALDVVARMREETPSIGWSAGVAVWNGDEDVRALLRRTDAALYEAKRTGRNRAVASRPVAA